MNKILVALAFLTGTLGAYAFDDPTYSDNYSDSSTVNDSPRYQDRYEDNWSEDSTSSGMSSTRAADKSMQSDSYTDQTTTQQSATSDNTFGSASNSTVDKTPSRLEGTLPEIKAVEPGHERWSAGLLAGVHSPNGDNTNSNPEFGVDIAFQPIVPFGFGVVATTTRFDLTDEQRTAVLPKATYNFGGDIPLIKDMYVGAGAGPIFQGSRVEWGVAPMVGFDIPIGKKQHDFISLGLNAKYELVSGIEDAFASNFALKYWF